MPRPSIIKKLKDGDLVEVPVEDLKITRDFNLFAASEPKIIALQAIFIDFTQKLIGNKKT